MATAAGVALHFDDSEAVACGLTDTFETGEQTLVDFLLQFAGAENERLGLRLGLREDLVELRTLLVEIDGTFLDVLGGLGFVR